MPLKAYDVMLILLLLPWAACQPTHSNKTDSQLTLDVPYGSPVIDGSGADAIWESTPWYPISELWEGTSVKPADFQGRYKIAWDENNLYLLVEIDDDTLTENTTPDIDLPHQADCLIIFLDEDASGGDPALNHNAFAYHLLLDGRVRDNASDSTWRTFDDHCWVRRITRSSTSTWEIALRVYDSKQYQPGAENIPKLLKAGKKMGFALAYGDRDNALQWESVVGNIKIASPKTNTPWQTADGYYWLNLR